MKSAPIPQIIPPGMESYYAAKAMRRKVFIIGNSIAAIAGLPLGLIYAHQQVTALHGQGGQGLYVVYPLMFAIAMVFMALPWIGGFCLINWMFHSNRHTYKMVKQALPTEGNLEHPMRVAQQQALNSELASLGALKADYHRRILEAYDAGNTDLVEKLVYEAQSLHGLYIDDASIREYRTLRDRGMLA